jgi:hypothetical protein
MDKSSNIKAKPSKTGPDTLFPNISRNAKTNQNNNTYQNISKIAGFSTSWCQQPPLKALLLKSLGHLGTWTCLLCITFYIFFNCLLV